MVAIALLGAGIFAQEAHLPAIQAATNITLKAVYSRSESSATAFASKTSSPVDIYHDSPSTPNKSLADLLARPDIDAVIVCLPILAQPAVIKQALAAGKHVLSEKPVAKDLAAAHELLEWYAARGAEAPVWAVAENFRYMESLSYAAERLAEVGGRVTTFSMRRNGLVRPDDKYYNTEWRKTPQYQGGFLLDGGVHFIAALRKLLDAAGTQLAQLASFSTLLEENLGPVDTVHAIATTRDGRTGTIVMSFGTEFKSGLEVEVVTTQGAVHWTPDRVRVTKKGASGAKEDEAKDFAYDGGVNAEVKAFASSLEAGKVDPLQTPQQALQDLEVLQRILESGSSQGAVKKLEA